MQKYIKMFTTTNILLFFIFCQQKTDNYIAIQLFYLDHSEHVPIFLFLHSLFAINQSR